MIKNMCTMLEAISGKEGSEAVASYTTSTALLYRLIKIERKSDKEQSETKLKSKFHSILKNFVWDRN